MLGPLVEPGAEASVHAGAQLVGELLSSGVQVTESSPERVGHRVSVRVGGATEVEVAV